ncbi:vps52 sac2 family protein, putative, partial [Ichthyophthirius multifiliis]
VVDELETLEKGAAYDYLKVEKEMNQLDFEIEKTDNILGELEGVLLNFRDHLNEIKSQMTVLQERSLKMNTSLTNRKNLQKLLNNFMDQVVLDPKLIDAINSQPIDKNYVWHIKNLCQKLEYLQNTQLPDSTAIKELEPELNKLKNKACGRIRDFLLEKITNLKKPMTNVGSQQINVLLDYRVFTDFLKIHYQEIYTELCIYYTETMSKLYLLLSKKNIQEAQKCMADLYSKNDTLVSDNVSNIRNQLVTKRLNISQGKNKSIFDIMGRDAILNTEKMQEDCYFYLTSQKNNEKFTIEQIFRSMCKLIINTVISETSFVNQFFNLETEQHIKIFKTIFSATFNYMFDFLRNTLSNTFDCVGVILIILINEYYQKECANLQNDILEYFFNNISMMAWPRFLKIYEGHLKSIEEKNIKVYKSVEKQLGFKIIAQRYVDLQLSFYCLYTYFGENQMLSNRIEQLRNEYVKLIKKSGEEIGKGLERNTYMLIVLDFIQTKFNECKIQKNLKEFQDDLTKLEKETNLYISEFINIFLKDLFGDLIDFVKQNAKEETEAQMKSMGEVFYEQQINNQNNKIINPQDNAKLIQNICTDFNFYWNKRIDIFKAECEKLFQGNIILKKILKKFLNIFITYYGTYFQYAKNNFPNQANSLIKTHEIMREIQKAYNI